MFDLRGTRTLIEEFKTNKTIDRIREWIADEASKSDKFHCPFCDKKVTVYHRPIHKEMGQFLMKLYQKDRQYSRFYPMRELDPTAIKAASDGSYLIHWGLVQKSGKQDDAPPNSYRITDKGRAFVSGQLMVPSHCYMLNNKVVGWSDRQMHIREVVENYEDLLYV